MLDTLSLAAALKPLTVLDSTGRRQIRPAVERPSSARTPIQTNMPILRQAYAKSGNLKDISLFFKPDSSECCAAVLLCYEIVGVVEALGPMGPRSDQRQQGGLCALHVFR